jgi:predicted nucleotidyltransferase component of viral defense system
MILFEKLVQQVIASRPELSPLKAVVEKELLHQDILRILSKNNLLKDLTFIGGTCLRTCYGGIRLSEDLDFTGGLAFTKTSLENISKLLIGDLFEKYGLLVEVSEPVKETTNVQTWKIKVLTHGDQKNLPQQRINIDICAIPSFEKKSMFLINPYGVDLGTNGLIIQAQSKEEIFVDKLIAFAFRPNRIKYRDVWDILWLHQLSVKPQLNYLLDKVEVREKTKQDLLDSFHERTALFAEKEVLMSEYKNEMFRFLPKKIIEPIFNQTNYRQSIIDVFDLYKTMIERELK